MKRKTKNKKKRAKSQISLELLLLLAAYLAFLGVLIATANQGFNEGSSAGKVASAQARLSAACFFIDFFALDGKGVLLGKKFGWITAEGKKLFYGNRTEECKSTARFEGSLKAEVAQIEMK